MKRARPSWHSVGVSVKPTPVVPVPAASLVLLRDRLGGGVEILLIQRHHRSRFAPGDFVFPGGKVEIDDSPP
ncbi:MAG: NUDIX domain-containing protein, partial [Candidatus Rokuibacteriota bacterium]